jgi:hypothetical protein
VVQKENNFKNKTIMTERDYELRLKVLYAQLRLIDAYEDEFIEKEGQGGLNRRRDVILDEINYLNKKFKKLRE